MGLEEAVTIRALREDDLTAIRSNWTVSYSRSDWARSVTHPADWQAAAAKDSRGRGQGSQVYWDGHRELVSRLVASSVLLVDEAPDGLIDGWICGWPRERLHYVYVRHERRKKGIARRLLEALELRPATPVRYTHRTPRILEGKPGAPAGWLYEPPRARIGLVLDEPKEHTTMAKHRIANIRFADGVAIPWRGVGASVEQREGLNERDGIQATLNDQTGIIEIQGVNSLLRKPAPVFVHLAQCKFALGYGPGDTPEERKAAEEAAANGKSAAP